MAATTARIILTFIVLAIGPTWTVSGSSTMRADDFCTGLPKSVCQTRVVGEVIDYFLYYPLKKQATWKIAGCVFQQNACKYGGRYGKLIPDVQATPTITTSAPTPTTTIATTTPTITTVAVTVPSTPTPKDCAAAKVIPDLNECYTGTGVDYHGQVHHARTSDGEEKCCLPWKQGEAGTRFYGDHNYCRNPKGRQGKERPWCFTAKNSDGTYDSEFCDVGIAASTCDIATECEAVQNDPPNSMNECFTQVDGSDYRGSKTSTKKGHCCLDWSQAHWDTRDLGAHNYCRNPDGKRGPWCYTSFTHHTGKYAYGFCDVGDPVKSCGEDQMLTRDRCKFEPTLMPRNETSCRSTKSCRWSDMLKKCQSADISASVDTEETCGPGRFYDSQQNPDYDSTYNLTDTNVKALYKKFADPGTDTSEWCKDSLPHRKTISKPMESIISRMALDAGPKNELLQAWRGCFLACGDTKSKGSFLGLTTLKPKDITSWYFKEAMCDLFLKRVPFDASHFNETLKFDAAAALAENDEPKPRQGFEGIQRQGLTVEEYAKAKAEAEKAKDEAAAEEALSSFQIHFVERGSKLQKFVCRVSAGRVCYTLADMYNKLEPYFADESYQPDPNKENKVAIFSSTHNPTPIWEFLPRTIAVHASGTINVWVRETLCIKEFMGNFGISSRGILRTLLINAPAVTRVNIFVQVPQTYLKSAGDDLAGVCKSDFVSELELKISVWKSFVCPDFAREEVTPYAVYAIDESFFKWNGEIKGKPVLCGKDESIEDPCPPNCEECEEGQDGPCITCDNNMFLNENGECVDDCGDKWVGVGEGRLGGVCEECPVGCLTCTSPNQCEACEGGYYLNPETFECVEDCPEYQYNPTMSEAENGLVCGIGNDHCLTSKDDGSENGRCLSCETPYKLLEGQNCVDNCPSGTTLNIVDGLMHCIVCLDNCASCRTSDTCSRCETGFHLTDNDGEITCESSCPSAGSRGKMKDVGTYAAIVEGVAVCDACPAHCAECNAQGICVHCKDFHFISDGVAQFGTCLSQCPTGFYESGDGSEGRRCFPCDDGCDKCQPVRGGSVCLTEE